MTALVKPGAYSATCYGEGFGFYSYTSATNTYNQLVTGNTSTDTDRTVIIQKTLSAPKDWFSIDNHHHGTRADAFSPAEVVAKAQTTAGLEVLTLDDHEYVVDNMPRVQLGQEDGGDGYMPSEEVTPSWAHFDVMPMTKAAYARFLDRDQQNRIVNTNAALQGIIDDGHNAGVAIGANHPNSGYGLFLADDNKTVPGGMTDDFDGIEAHGSGTRRTDLGEAMSYWNAYLTGGSYRGVAVTAAALHLREHRHPRLREAAATSGARRSYVYVEGRRRQEQGRLRGLQPGVRGREPGRRPQLQLQRRLHNADERQDVRQHVCDRYDRQVHGHVQGVGAQPHHEHLRIRQHRDRDRELPPRHEEPRLPDDVHRQAT